MSLYNKYRPQSIAEMQGDFKAIENELKLPNHNHTFLFTGSSGTGKSSMARIIAKLVGAEDMDIEEVNGANTNGVDDIRALLSDLMICPMGKAHVYIIDECHKITTAAQNALLKPLEDTPEHAYFILCSSEPRTIIKAIQTRATVFNFPPLTGDMIYEILRDIKKQEGFSVDKSILLDIAEVVGGSAREAINILEKIGNLSKEEQEKEVGALGDGLGDAEVIDLCRTLYDKKSWSKMREVLRGLKEKGAEPESVRRAVLGYGQSILLNKEDDAIACIMGQFLEPFFNTGFPGLTHACYMAWAKDVRGF